MTYTVNLKRTINAKRERVFKAWTDIGDLKQWWGPMGYSLPSAEVDMRVGGQYRLGMKSPEGSVMYLTGTFQKVEPPEKLVYTWKWETPEGNSEETLVTVKFEDRGDHTEVVMTHELLGSDEARQRHTEGWTGCFDRLEKMFA